MLDELDLAGAAPGHVWRSRTPAANDESSSRHDSGGTNGRTTNLENPTAQEFLQHVTQPVDAHRDHLGRVHAAAGGRHSPDHLGRKRLGGVGNRHPEMLGADGASGFRGRLVDDDPGRRHLLRRTRGGKPSVGEPTAATKGGRNHAPGPELEGFLHRKRGKGHAVEMAGIAIMADRLPVPQPPDQWKHLVHQPPLGSRPHPHRIGLRLGGTDRDEGDQEPSSRQPVEAGQLLGQPDRVVTGKEDGGAQFEPAGYGRRRRRARPAGRWSAPSVSPATRSNRTPTPPRRRPRRPDPLRRPQVPGPIPHRCGSSWARPAMTGHPASHRSGGHGSCIGGPSKRSTVAKDSTGWRRSRVG